MEHIEGVDEKGGCARTGQRGSNFRTDMSALADSGDDDLSVTTVDELNGAVEVLVETGYQVENGLRFFADDLYGVFFGRFHDVTDFTEVIVTKGVVRQELRV